MSLAQDSDYYSDSFCDTAGEDDVSTHRQLAGSETDTQVHASHPEQSAAPGEDDGRDPVADTTADDAGSDDGASSSSAARSRRASMSSSCASPDQLKGNAEGGDVNDSAQRGTSSGGESDGPDPATQDAFNSTIALRASPLRKSGGATSVHGRAQRREANRHRTSAGDGNSNNIANNSMLTSSSRRGHRSPPQNKPLTKLQKYAVEEGIFAPLHAAIDDSRLSQLVTRLYDPEPLRQRTFRAAEQRREKVQYENYNAVQDAHLVPYWQRKVWFKGQLRQEALQKQQNSSPLRHHHGAHTPLPSQHGNRHKTSGGALPQIHRPATCPPPHSPDESFTSGEHPQKNMKAEAPLQPVESLAPDTSYNNVGCDGSASAFAASPSQSRSGRRRRRSSVGGGSHDDDDTARSSRSSSSSSGCASSPEWKEQRPGSAPRTAATAEGGVGNESVHRTLSATRSQRTGGASTTTKSQIDRLTTVKRKDLYALWMAARPPSPFQRLISRLSYNPSQAFRLNWLVQKKSPPPGGTLREVPQRAPPRDDDAASTTGIRISSPRSAYVMLRQGIMVEDITPVSLQRFYLDGSLKGIPAKVSEYHFAAREKLRKELLDEILRAYDAICATVSQESFVRKLYAVNPEENKEALLSREDETICGGAAAKRSTTGSKGTSVASRSSSASAVRRRNLRPAVASDTTVDAAQDPTAEGGRDNPQDGLDGSPTNHDAPSFAVVDPLRSADSDEANDGAAAKRRIQLTIQKQQRRQDKYMQQLDRNAQLLRKRAAENKLREDVAHEKHDKLLRKRAEENLRRREEHARREAQLQAKRDDAARLEKERQEKLLEKIKKGEEHASALAKKREEIRLLQHEERKILEETKIEIVARREKQNDYENLLLIDRIRRKVGRAQAMQEMRAAAMMQLKERRERNLVEMEQRTEEFAEQLLAYERKHLTN